MLTPNGTGRSTGRSRKGAVAASAVTAVLLVLAVVVYLAFGNSDSSSASPKLYYPDPNGGFGGSLAYHGDAPWSFGAVALCLTGPGTVTVTGVHPIGGNGQLKLLGFATRPMPKSALGAAQETLTQFGFPSSATVTTTCVNGLATELGTTWQRTGSGNGRFDNLRVDYTSAGKAHSLMVPWRLKLCGPAKTTDEACGPADTP
jgi:hypothetical protein